ncbi:MAG: amylo-alpha-1,6-glucosidase [Prevotellaceae bacterium]|jgi:predicted glycogen debranching enzyme|nr:amylo-alpha-1,6-glucosidase [Prevotellaceae bacterium]
MSYLSFNKEELVNLEYSLHRELLGSNRAGSYMSTTIVCCNTRKYHGLLVSPIDNFDGERHVLLSALDETIVQHDQAFNFGIHRYDGGVYEPKGHKYIVDFKYDPTPTIEYRVGGVHLRKELLMVHNEDQVMIRYTLLDAHSNTILRLKPYLAFRNAHTLSKANVTANVKLDNIANGVASKMYEGFPVLNMQLNKKCEFTIVPDWYYGMEYIEEQKRGYDYKEDLLVPGFFEVPIKKEESIIFSAALKEVAIAGMSRKFDAELGNRPEKKSFKACLKNSADQFIVRRGKDTEVVAGYPWFGRWGRDTFIALPGITLSAVNSSGQSDEAKKLKTCKDVLDTMSREMKGGLFPNIGKDDKASFNSVDAPMWYFWAIQQYEEYTGNREEVWKSYGKKMKEILEAFRRGTGNVSVHDNGLVWAEEFGKALTWMDAIADGTPVTPRSGYQVEINALWYNAICYTLELAEEFKDTKFVKTWKDVPQLIKDNYKHTFWVEENKCLADFVNREGQNTYVRPNQVFATSLKYSPISEGRKKSVLEVVTSELLTTRGLRTLTPKNHEYVGHYEGDQKTRDRAYHQGTVWPWLIGHYIEGNLKLYGKAFVSKAKWIMEQFEEDIADYGISSIAEVYDGDPPHRQGGCISQAWSVGEVLRAIRLIEKYEKAKG